MHSVSVIDGDCIFLCSATQIIQNKFIWIGVIGVLQQFIFTESGQTVSWSYKRSNIKHILVCKYFFFLTNKKNMYLFMNDPFYI